MRIPPSLLLAGLCLVGLVALHNSAPAASLYWSGNGTSQGGAGTWNTTLARWGAVGAGPYTTVWNNTANATDTAIFGSSGGAVTLGVGVTVNTIQFNGSGYSIVTGGGTTITLGGTGPTVSCAQNATINAVIAGGGKQLTKANTATLTLGGANTYNNGTALTAGSIVANNNAALGTGTLIFSGSSVRLTIGNGITINNAITIGANSGVAGFNLIHVASPNTATVSGPITINNAPAAGGHFGSTLIGGVLNVSGPISSSVPVSQRAGTVVYGGGGTGYTTLAVNQHTAKVGANNGIATTATVNLGSAGGATLDLNGFNQSLVGVTRVANTVTITNSSVSSSSTLTLTGTSTFAGTIDDDGVNKVNLTVNGGALTLTAGCTYSGDTTVDAGTLTFSGSGSVNNSPNIILANSGTVDVSAYGGAASVLVGQTLSGSGSVSGGITVAGAVSPSGTFPSTIAFNNTLGLSGTGSFRIGSGLTSDQLTGVTAFTSGGTLNVTWTGAGAPAGGDTYQLVTATSYGGSAPAAGTMPSLGSGLNWYLGKMPVNGTISVNRAPTGGSGVATSVSLGGSVTISLAEIIAKYNLADADADSLSVSAVGGSPARGSASFTGSGVTYTSSGASAGADSFTYTVSDGRGGTVVNTINLTVIGGGNGANITSLTGSVPNITINFAGMPSSNYAIERSSSPSGPWTEIAASVSTGANGLGSYTDTAATSSTGYYRTRYVP